MNVSHDSFVKMRWENLGNNRYYEAIIKRDFFDWVLIKRWGKKNTLLGNSLCQVYSEFREGEAQLSLIHERRLQHCYHLINEQTAPSQ